jgi:RloB-like protein
MELCLSFTICRLVILLLMPEPWDLRSQDSRSSDQVPVFIIFCEDGAVEPAYLRSMASDKVQLSIIENCGQHHQNVDRTTNYLRENGMLEVVGGMEVLAIQEGLQVWCMYDRDRDKAKDDGKDTAFNDSIATAQARGIKVAWSNDNFELWILLHFEEVDITDDSYHFRDTYYMKLEAILKDQYHPSTDVGAKVRNPLFTYRESLKSGKQFSKILLPLLAARMNDACSRAILLENHHKDLGQPMHQKVPCTMMHHLCEEILAVKQLEP